MSMSLCSLPGYKKYNEDSFTWQINELNSKGQIAVN